MKKSFCDKCGKEIFKLKGSFDIGLTTGKPVLDFSDLPKDSADYGCHISRRGKLCLDCYKKLNEWFSRI